MKLLDTDLEFLRGIHDEHLQDTCDILRYLSESKSPRGASVAVRSEENDVPCGFNGTSRKYLSPDMTIITVDATLRLPIDTQIGVHDRVRITHRHGEEVTGLEFEVNGEPVRGPAGIVVGLVRKSWAT